MSTNPNNHSRAFKDLTGKTFGYLTVLRISHRKQCKSGVKTYWLCRCVCGREKVMSASNLPYKDNPHCGCKRTATDAPGMSRSREYNIWNAMIQRCYNPKTKSYQYYGARGITVCDRWRTSLAAFIEDMWPPPSSEHSIDRIDTDGPYCPENCRWATRQEQASNKRSNKLFLYNGSLRTVAYLSWISGVPYGTLWRRLVIDKWPLEQAIQPAA